MNDQQPTTEQLKNFVRNIRQGAPKGAVRFTLHITASEWVAEYTHRDPETLKLDGISMRELSGDFIR